MGSKEQRRKDYLEMLKKKILESAPKILELSDKKSKVGLSEEQDNILGSLIREKYWLKGQLPYPGTFSQYLDDIISCDDPDRLELEFNISPYIINFYEHDVDFLFYKIRRDLMESPKDGGIRDSWIFYNDEIPHMVTRFMNPRPFMSRFRGTYFNWEFGTVELKLVEGEIGGDEDLMNGNLTSCYVVITPSQKRKVKDIHWPRVMVQAISGIGEYIIKEGLTVKCPYIRNLKYVPENKK